ncbi:uncharacterized protein A4U43_UnF1640 [Asparagus officinalis]|uniref:3'-5' exonuclease domain-containing protein n=1 Tax=Asparagus officinalis TaxID=4686 RepID=A0A1R3L7H6_ASPOF|nr:uncharacterized protein A4U43_UnF1640 [Asparagus officinalis]
MRDAPTLTSCLWRRRARCYALRSTASAATAAAPLNLFSLSILQPESRDACGIVAVKSSRTRSDTPISLCQAGPTAASRVGDVNVKQFRSEVLKDIVPLKRLLEDRRITIVGIGMEKFVKKAKEELGIDRVANPRELKSLVDEAFGKNKLGPRVNPEVEEMAELVLDGMKNVREKEKKVKSMVWGTEKVTEDAVMYATRDAYFAFEIGNKCLDLIGRKGSKSG